MKKRIVSLFAAAAALVACSEQPEVITPAAVSIEPVITRALSLNFQDGNKIGLDIVKNDEAKTVFAENAMLTYAGTSFVKEDLNWYPDGGTTCTLSAYYPYQVDGFPETFTIATDQSAGTESSDFMVATKTEVRPSASPIVMNFKHMFSQIKVVVTNAADIPVENITLKGVLPTATVAVAEGVATVTADATAEKVTVIAEPLEANKQYAAIIVPQSISNLVVGVKIQDGATLVTAIPEAEVRPGYTYTIAVEILASEVTAKIAGEIDAWEDGGILGAGEYVPSFEEHDGYFIYDDVRYNTVTLSNGQIWMAEPLAYLPFGKTASANPAEGSIFYPYSLEGTTAVALTDATSIKACGYLYTANEAYNATVTAENWTTFEGTQGICPKGWHIPSRAEYFALCGNSTANSLTGETGTITNTEALFWDSSLGYASIVKFNEAGFNYTMSGCVYSGTYRTNVTTATTCAVEDLVGKFAMSYSWTSTAQALNKAGVPQIFACMTTFTSANKYGKISLAQTVPTTGATLRCIKNATVTE